MVLPHPFYDINVNGLLYASGREAFLAQTISWQNDTIRVGLIDTEYTYDETHETVADISANLLFWNDSALVNKAVIDGYAVSDSAVFTGVVIPENRFVRGFVFAKVEAGSGDPLDTDPLIAFGDDAGGFSTYELGQHDILLRPAICGPFRAWFRL